MSFRARFGIVKKNEANDMWNPTGKLIAYKVKGDKLEGPDRPEHQGVWETVI